MEVPTAKVGLDPGVARALQEIADASFILIMLPLSVLAAAVTIVTLKTQVLPTWIGWISTLIAPILLVNGVILGNEIGLGLLLFMLWTIIVSVVLTRRAGGRVSADKPSVETSSKPEPVR